MDGDGRVHPHYKEHIEKIISSLEAAGYSVFCAVKYENWTISPKRPPADAVAEDLAEIRKADLLLAVLHEDASRGVQYEMGYAAGLDKAVIVATEPKDKLAYFNKGLIDSGVVKRIVYDSPEELATEIKKLIGQ